MLNLLLVCFALSTSITLCQECRSVWVCGEDSSRPSNNRQTEKGEPGAPGKSGPIGPAGPRGGKGVKGEPGSNDEIEAFEQEIRSLVNSKSFILFQKTVTLAQSGFQIFASRIRL